MGGRSSEREVSLSSGQGVLSALGASEGVRAAFGVCIEPDGRWSLYGEPLQDAIAALGELSRRADVCFLALHGGEGENGSIQGLLGAAGLAFTGSGVVASAVCMDKQATRTLAADAGVRVAPGRLIPHARFDRADLAALAALSDSGWVVKPRHGGSSVDTHMLARAEELPAAVQAAFTGGDDALCEARVRGVEVSCGVLGNRGEDRRALPPIEIRPRAGRFFDYEEKYSEAGAEELCPAVSLDAAECERVQAAAVRMHALCGCDGYSRADFIVTPDGEPVLLELNTLPGLTPRSLLPQEARQEGLSYTALCLWILEAGLRAGRER
jgi:D-alanine-D-alanine ligase